MYAIVKDGGRQFRAEKGATIDFDRKAGLVPGKKVEFDEVLLLHDGTKAQVGTPTVKGAKVIGEVISEKQDKKIRVHYYIRREGYARTLGHRQKHTVIKITDIKTK